METHATPQGTQNYFNKFGSKLNPNHYRNRHGLLLSSIGLGTYLGQENDRTDEAYAAAIEKAILSGCNFLDTAINYRCQRSERVIGRVLKKLIGEKKISRDEIVVATKAGFIPFDNEVPRDYMAYIQKTFIDAGICKPEEIIDGCHAMTPRYLEFEINQSLANLQLQCLDIFYIHNPETQLQQLSAEEFYPTIEKTFAFLEEQVKQKRIQFYGAATWTAFRSAENSQDHISLEKLIRIAEKIAGKNHHFKFIQLPFNLGMPEALTVSNQSVDGTKTSTLQAAPALGLTVVTSASILQGRLSRNLPKAFSQKLADLSTDAQRALQFVRSTPGVTTALVGMSSPAHVSENLSLAAIPPIPEPQFIQLFLQ